MCEHPGREVEGRGDGLPFPVLSWYVDVASQSDIT